MSQYIQAEAELALHSFLLGLLFMVSYDLLRLLRLMIPHGNVWIGIEDFLYWLYCTAMTFSLLFWENSGVLRGYVIGLIFISMYLYDRIVSRRIFELLKNAERWITMKKRRKTTEKGAGKDGEKP